MVLYCRVVVNVGIDPLIFFIKVTYGMMFLFDSDHGSLFYLSGILSFGCSLQHPNHHRKLKVKYKDEQQYCNRQHDFNQQRFSENIEGDSL